MSYDPKEIEARWQRIWDEEGTWVVPNPGQPGFDQSKPKDYVLEMLPYPSGEPHVGHLKCYSVGDAIAHFRRRRGFRVVHPMGYDAFGLPAENNAIETGEHPREATEKSIVSFREQFRRWGISIDWTRELGTHEPSYYRWTQWIFLKLYERGLAYREEAPVQWCPQDQTVLANEQVIDGHCERCGSLVEQKRLEQWFFKITEYAQHLLDDFELLESWPENVVTMQRNWIGRSEGLRIRFAFDRPAPGGAETLEVFTTRPDTLFGASFMALSPDHPVAAASAAESPALAAFIAECRRMGTSAAAIEAAGAVSVVPDPPRGLLKKTRSAWVDFWGSDVARAVDAASDMPAIERLFRLRDDRERAHRTATKSPLVAGSQGQSVANPMWAVVQKCDVEIRALEDRFGLNSKSRLQLGIHLLDARKKAKEGWDDLEPDWGDADDTGAAEIKVG